MKVIHINTNSSGGAATAAIRLHKGLLKAGVDSRILFLHNQLKGEEYATYINAIPTLTQRVFRKLTSYKSIEEKNRLQITNKPKNYETLSFPLTSYNVEQHPWVQEADIIHLHWISNFINYPSFFKAINKPIVWTLHDMNPIQGIFHYDEDKKTNEEAIGNIEKKMADIKYNSIKNLKELSVVTPSAWLGNVSSNSKIFKGFDHSVIPYGLDTNVFKPINKPFARRVFNLPEDKILLLFVSERIENRRKGFDLLLKAIDSLDNKDNIAVCAVGVPGKLEINNLYNIGPVNDERLMSILYAAADAFILPSREDNLPNVMLESLACGTPVISFNTGGMKEVIKNGFNGILAEQVSADALTKAINDFIVNKELFNREAIRQYAANNFKLSIQANAYFNLYKQLI